MDTMNTITNEKKFPVNSKIILARTFAAMAIIIFFSLYFGIATGQSLTLLTTITYIAIWVVLLLIIYLSQRAFYRSYRYSLDDHFIKLSYGAITHTHISIPYDRLQDILINQDICERVVNLYSIRFDTATLGARRMESVSGLTKENAEAFRDLILTEVKKSRTK